MLQAGHGDFPLIGNQAQNGVSQGGFAAAALSHQAEELILPDGQADILKDLTSFPVPEDSQAVVRIIIADMLYPQNILSGRLCVIHAISSRTEWQSLVRLPDQSNI